MNIISNILLAGLLLSLFVSRFQEASSIIRDYWGKKWVYRILVCEFIQATTILHLWFIVVNFPASSSFLFTLLLFLLFAALLLAGIMHIELIREYSPLGMSIKTSALFERHCNVEALAQAELTLQSSGLDSESRSNIHFIRALCFFRLNRMADSLDAINLAIKINPTQDEFVLHRGNLYFSEGRYPEAMEDYETALKLAQNGGSNTNLPGVQNTFAWFLASGPEEFRDGKRALELAKHACKKKNSGNYADTLAAAYAEVGQFEEAVALLKEIVSKCPKEYEPRYQERLALYQQGLRYRIPAGKIEMIKEWLLFLPKGA